MKNFVKRNLNLGKTSVGTWIQSPNPDTAEILSRAGFDWIVFDMEHGLFSTSELQRMLQAMDSSRNCLPIVRLPINDPVYYKWALDIGAYGVIVPMVNTAQEAIRAVSSSKYPPDGIRGSGARRASKYYSDFEDYMENANTETLVIIMIESKTALDSLDEILAVEGVDVAFVGPSDLSLSLGIKSWRRDVNTQPFEDALDTVVSSCRMHDVVPGLFCSEENISREIKRGFRFCVLGDDDTFLIAGAKSMIEKVQGWSPSRS